MNGAKLASRARFSAFLPFRSFATPMIDPLHPDMAEVTAAST